MLEHNHGLYPCTWRDQESVVSPWERDKRKSNSGRVSVARRRRRNTSVLEPAPCEPATVPSTWHVLVHSVLTTPLAGRFCHRFYLINEALRHREVKYLAWGCTTRRWQGWGPSPRSDPKAHDSLVTGSKWVDNRWKLLGSVMPRKHRDCY